MGLAEMDKDGLCVYINPAGARMLGYETHELVGRDMHATIHYRRANGLLYPRSECAMTVGMNKGESCLSEKGEVFWSKDGQMVPVSFRGDPIVENGMVVGAAVTFLDAASVIYVQALAEAEIAKSYVAILKKVSGTANSVNNVEEAMGVILEEVMESFGYEVGHAFFRMGSQQRHCWQSKMQLSQEYKNLSEEVFEERIKNSTNHGIVGQALKGRRAAWLTEETQGIPMRGQMMREMGLKSAIVCPILSGEAVVGLFEFEGTKAGPPASGLGELLMDIGLQMGWSVERILTQERLETSEAALRARVQEMEDLDRENRLLNEIGNLLDGSRSLEEVSEILSEYGARLFPDGEGDLSLGEEGGSEVKQVARWGKETSRTHFEKMDCWALRRGRVHETSAKSQLRCAHIMVKEGWDLCMPLNARTGMLGVMHLHDKDGGGEIREKRRARAKKMAEQVSLALVNFDLRERLRYQAFHDSLTGLYNLRYMEEVLAKEIEKAETTGLEMAVLEIDIDYFKTFNDDFGHDFGDETLRTLARFLDYRVREGDTLCRIGGEEFMILMPGSNMQTALERAEKIRAGVSEITARRAEATRKITVSVGVATYPEYGREYGELMRSVDEALYKAKRSGRNQVVAAVKPTQ